MVRVAVDNGKPVRIGVNWGSLDSALLTRMMDENARLADPLDADEVMRNAISRARCAPPRWPRNTACLTTLSS